MKTEQDLIREAVEEHGKRGVKHGRRASKVNTFNYKKAESDKRKRADALQAEQERVYGLREPRPPSELDVFTASLTDDQKVFARMYFQMECDHGEFPLATLHSFVEGTTLIDALCERCGLVRKWMGNKTETARAEWMSYCPDGFDMFDWLDLYTKDRGAWRFIHDEVLSEMMEGVEE